MYLSQFSELAHIHPADCVAKYLNSANLNYVLRPRPCLYVILARVDNVRQVVFFTGDANRCANGNKFISPSISRGSGKSFACV